MKRALLLLILFTIATVPGWSDGGTVQFQKQAGPFVITLFSEPTPVRVGIVDLSLLCQKSSDRTPVSDAHVLIRLRKPGAGDITEFVLIAHPSSANKQLYAVSANLLSPGNWPIRVSVQHSRDEASVSAVLKVLPPQPAVIAYWPIFVAVPLVALLFVINVRLRRRRLRRPAT